MNWHKIAVDDKMYLSRIMGGELPDGVTFELLFELAGRALFIRLTAPEGEKEMFALPTIDVMDDFFAELAKADKKIELLT